MRSPLLFVAGIVALAAACGGKTSGIGGNNGGSSGGGSSSGSTGSSSGGISGSSSGGATCSPLPGCTSSEQCPDPSGCGECFCNDGEWECDSPACIDGGLPDAFPPPHGPYGICPGSPPAAGEACSPDGIDCPYGGSQGDCGETCLCENGGWQCFADPCPPPSCPPDPPASGTACFGFSESCFYGDDAGCGGEECDCDPSGIWSCGGAICLDASPPPPVDASPCPGAEPKENSACPFVGNVCTYFTACESNCLCTETGWVCATESGCSDE